MLQNFPTKLSLMVIAAATAVTATAPALASPSVNGRYEGLIQTMYCPQAESEYGRYNHYGYWNGGDYICDDQYAEAGYWVYQYPNWYVWAYDTDTYNDTSFNDPSSAYGSYANLVQILTCYEDQGTYGEYYDYGYWSGGEWCGEKAEEGYWVYDAPDWYIWSSVN